MDDENKLSNTSRAEDGEKASVKNSNGTSVGNKSAEACINQDNDSSGTQIASSDDTVSGVDGVSGALEHVNISSAPPEREGENDCFFVLSFSKFWFGD